MTVSIADIKKLRDATLAGMMDCKNALVETKGDFTKAKEYLKAKGLLIASKKSDRETDNGLVTACVSDDSSYGAILTVKCETDFVARNDKFQGLIQKISNVAVSTKCNDLSALRKSMIGDATVDSEIASSVAILGENIQLTNFESFSVETGVIASYVHGVMSANSGSMVSMVCIESTGDRAKLVELGKKIAMHITASKPLAISVDQLPSDTIAAKQAAVEEHESSSGKPAEIVKRIVAGKINKYYSEVVLLKQPFVMDSAVTIEDLLDMSSKDLGAEIKIVDYKLSVLGNDE